MKAKRYDIRTVADIRKVPEDRRQQCLSELLLWSKLMDQIEGTEGASVRSGDGKCDADTFVWLDDGRMSVDLSLEMRSERG